MSGCEEADMLCSVLAMRRRATLDCACQRRETPRRYCALDARSSESLGINTFSYESFVSAFREWGLPSFITLRIVMPILYMQQSMLNYLND
jgi:hypothetical protein